MQSWFVVVVGVSLPGVGFISLQSPRPLYSFEDNGDYVYDVEWSPIHPALFATVDGTGRLDLWNLNNDTEVSSCDTIIGTYLLHSNILSNVISETCFTLRETLLILKKCLPIQSRSQGPYQTRKSSGNEPAANFREQLLIPRNTTNPKKPCSSSIAQRAGKCNSQVAIMYQLHISFLKKKNTRPFGPQVPTTSATIENQASLNRVRWTHNGHQISVGDDDGHLYMYDVGEVSARDP